MSTKDSVMEILKDFGTGVGFFVFIGLVSVVLYKNPIIFHAAVIIFSIYIVGWTLRDFYRG